MSLISWATIIILLLGAVYELKNKRIKPAIIYALLSIFLTLTVIFPSDPGLWKEKWVCDSKDRFLNITPEEYNCPLSNCMKLNDDPYVEMCDCEKTNTKIFTWCDYERRIRSYEGNADDLRGKVLTNNQNVLRYVNLTNNPGITLKYSDGSKSQYVKKELTIPQITNYNFSG